MKKSNILIIGVLITQLIYLPSCKKFVEIAPPKNQLVGSQIFADSLDATAAITGIYVSMVNAAALGFSSGGLTLYPALSSDEMNQTGTDVSLAEFYNDGISVNNSVNKSLWSGAYKLIYSTNACLEGISGSNTLAAQTKSRMMGEVRCIRALLYFNLVNLYGSVPVVTATDFNTNELSARSPVTAVYQKIKDDLIYAKGALPKTGFVTQRANYYAAVALLSKVALYTGDNELALSAATEIINSNNFKLLADLNGVFLAASQESIWKIIPVFPNRETWEGYYFAPSSATTKPKYTISNALYNAFDANDQRKVKWITVNTVSGVKYPYPSKYKKASTTTTPTENYTIMRLAEIYLIRAEARALLNDFTGALADLNTTRNRASLGNMTGSDQDSILTAIEKERQLEMFCEWGNRWFDLKRYGHATSVLGAFKTSWKNTSQLYPIPINEITANPSLLQNPGY